MKTEPSEVAAAAVSRLAGISGRTPARARYLAEHETGAIAIRMYRARVQAGLSARRFASMDSAAVRVFAARFDVARVDVLLAIELVKFIHSARRIQLLGGHSDTEARNRRARSTQH